MKAAGNLGHELTVAHDVNDSIGIIDSIFLRSKFFTDFERFEGYAH